MSTMVRTMLQWVLTARMLERPFASISDHQLAARIHAAIAAVPFARPEQIVAVTLTPEEQARVEQVAPLRALQLSPGTSQAVPREQEVRAALTEAEAIIRDHQRRPD